MKRHRLFNRGVKRWRPYEETSSLQETDLNSLKIKRRSPLCREATPLQQRGNEASPHYREATPLQQGVRQICSYLKRKKLEIKANKWRTDANKHKSTSNTYYFTYSSHQSSIKYAKVTTKQREIQTNNSKWNESPKNLRTSELTCWRHLIGS